jgi:predicted RNA-binding protein YlxR (DUF448 family)
MSRTGHVAVRTCIGCGVRAPQQELLCVASVSDGTLQIVDGRRRLGRTGYLHRRHECWERFAARKGAVRSLGRNVEKSVRMAVVQKLNALDPPAMVK